MIWSQYSNEMIPYTRPVLGLHIKSRIITTVCMHVGLLSSICTRPYQRAYSSVALIFPAISDIFVLKHVRLRVRALANVGLRCKFACAYSVCVCARGHRCVRARIGLCMQLM